MDYIVRQTVGKLVEGKTPKQAADLRVLDPACCSGSFLINGYQYLLDWHRDWYVVHKPEGWAKGRNPVLVQTTGGWKLTIAERKRILLDNIYGVDIDPQAVEVTKLSLLLKVLEGASEQTIQPIDFSSSTDTAIHGHMVKLVDQMIELRVQISNAKNPHEKEALQRQINATDKQIDQLVYQLYGLTDEEIKIVEGA